MYIHWDEFGRFLRGYCRVLRTMVTTSLLRVLDSGISITVGGPRSEATVQFPKMVGDWLQWRPESNLEEFVRGFTLLLLIVLGIFCLLIALVKFSLWLIGLIPAIVVCFLLSVELNPTGPRLS